MLVKPRPSQAVTEYLVDRNYQDFILAPAREAGMRPGD